MRSRSIELSYLQDMNQTLFEIREVGPCLDKYGMGRYVKTEVLSTYICILSCMMMSIIDHVPSREMQQSQDAKRWEGEDSS